MVTFNFLPWRENQRAYLKRQQKRSIAAVSAVMILLIILMHVLLQHWVDSLKLRLSQLQPQVEKAMLRQAVQSSLKTGRESDKYEVLAHSQDVVAQLFFRLFNSHSDSMCFTQVNRYQNRIHFQGIADSPPAFASFLMNWPLMASFQQIQIKKMDHDSQGVLGVAFEGMENESRWPEVKQRKSVHSQW